MVKRALPYFSIFTVVLIIGILNFSPDKFLIGWDNLLPEFNFKLNITRSIFSVWEEYQGLGLLSGNGHAASLIHQLILFPFSFFMPINYLRPLFTLSMLLFGTIGAYKFSLYILKERSIKTQLHKNITMISALLASLFYLLSLATVQNFYVPFEPFVIHFAVLPWLIFSALNYVKKQTHYSLLLLVLINILAIPQGQVPTVFIVYLFVLSTILFTIGFKTKKTIAGLKVISITLILNSFWLLPFLYFALTSTQVAIGAKINQMSTETVISQNKEFGTLIDTILLKGFWFNRVDTDLHGKFIYMMGAWKEHVDSFLVLLTGLSLFSIVILGVIIGFIKKTRVNIAFIFLFIFSFIMLANDTFPFSIIDFLFRKIPLFDQVFRFPFTKFSTITALTFSVFFALGVRHLLGIGVHYSKKVLFLAPIIIIGLLVFLSLPTFKGNLFYEKEKIEIPGEYFEVFEFFDKQDPNTRIANFPLHTFWGWNFYNWGYGGSGFLWYGIKQPIMDRAFDVWSKESENYYFELSNALYTKDSKLFLNTLEKYQITWLMLDKNIYSPDSPRSLFYEESESLFSQILEINEFARFGKIIVYKVNLKNVPSSFLLSKGRLSSINPYKWSSKDNAIKDGFYTDKKPYTSWYPFRTLFTGKNYSDIEFELKESDDSFIFNKVIPKKTELSAFHIPSLLDEKSIPAEFTFEKDIDGTAIISVRVIVPQIEIADKLIKRTIPLSYPLFIIPDANDKYTVEVNGKHLIFDSELSQTYSTMLSLTQDNSLSLIHKNYDIKKLQTIKKEFLKSLPELSAQKIELTPEDLGEEIKIIFPKITDSLNGFMISPVQFEAISDCNKFRNGFVEEKKTSEGVLLTSNNDSLCSSNNFPSLTHESGYIITIESNNIEGNPLHFWVDNTSQKHAVLNTYLDRETTNYNFIIPPMEKFGQGYSLNLDSISIGDNTSQNEVKKIGIYPFSYSFLSNIILTSQKNSYTNSLTFNASHPNESLYVLENIRSNNNSTATLILSQSYHLGWQAYKINNYNSRAMNYASIMLPFIFGEKIQEHVKVNNWENGWILNNPSSISEKRIVIIFLPQYLQYLGFLLVGILITTVPMIIYRKKIITQLKMVASKLNSFFEQKANILKLKVTDSIGKKGH